MGRGREKIKCTKNVVKIRTNSTPLRELYNRARGSVAEGRGNVQRSTVASRALSGRGRRREREDGPMRTSPTTPKKSKSARRE